MLLIIFTIFLPFIKGESLECQKIALNAAFQDKNTIVDTSMKTLNGLWLSEGCETRPGPEYVLRHYTFRENGKYMLIQHHYWEDSCSSPKLTIISHGIIKTRRDSFLNHDALTGYVTPLNITITPQDFKSAKELNTIISSYCPGQYWKSWRRYEEQSIYTNNIETSIKSPYNNFQLSSQNLYEHNTQQDAPNASTNIACLGPLRWAFNELKLLKIQLRPNSNLITNRYEMHWELLLGDIPSRPNIREQYMPTGYQTPLFKVSKGENIILKGQKYLVKHSCNICSSLMANKRVPPPLIKKPRLPPYIEGVWVSDRCEIRPFGLYLTRRFSFFDGFWAGEHSFFADAFCTIPKFVVTAAGSFVIPETNRILPESSNIDFKIERATLMIDDPIMVRSIPMGTCGEEIWKIGVAQELSLTHGCLQLGIVIPSVQYDIVKIDMNYQGFWLLSLGQADTENLPRGIDGRPTAFQLPLVKCGDGKNFFGEMYSGDFIDNGSRKLMFVYQWVVFSISGRSLFTTFSSIMSQGGPRNT